MYITKIYLQNFRNYSLLDIETQKKAVILVGKNAQGKTNLLESIYFCSFFKSFRTSLDSQLIKQGESNFLIYVNFIKNKRNQSIECMVKGDKQKQIKKNGVKIRTLKECVGVLKTVIFSPDDLSLVKSTPDQRRRFLNRELSSLFPSYMNDIFEYHNVLEQRNALLKLYQKHINSKEKQLEDIDIWDEQLVNYAGKIIEKRFWFVSKLSSFSNIQNIRISKEELELSYKSSIDKEPFFWYTLYKNNNFLVDDFISYYKKILKKNIYDDIKYGSTQLGIHRDDLFFLIDGKDAKKYSSQGQQRSAILALRLAQINLILEETGENPILLLDDVLSELDENRQSMLLETIFPMQCFITTTHTNSEFKKLGDYQEIYIENAKAIIKKN